MRLEISVEKALLFIRERLRRRLYGGGGSRGTVEREGNEIRLTLWAAATCSAKKRDRWR